MKRSAIQKTPLSHAQLGSVIERDETPENGPQPTLDSVLSPSNGRQQTEMRSQLAELSTLKTPKTAPRPVQSEMHPELIHKSTTKAPDSGLRLGFSDIGKENTHETPSKTHQMTFVPEQMSSPGFEFKFVSDKKLSEDAQNLRAEIRDKASQIKEQMRAQRYEQGEVEEGIFSATGRKIAKPKGKAGRFSDVHIAEFKKMDSIENHPSAFRAKPKFAQPTANSLKRSGSKAGLDEPDRPRTAGKGLVAAKSSISGPDGLSLNSAKLRFGFSSALKSSQPASPVKRARQFDDADVSAARPVSRDSEAEFLRSSNLPRPKSSSSLFTPTKASLGHSKSSLSLSKSPSKSTLLPRSTASSLVNFDDKRDQAGGGPLNKTSVPNLALLPKSPSMKQLKDATTVSLDNVQDSRSLVHSLAKRLPPPPMSTPIKTDKGMKSKLPTFSGLKSILRRTASRPISNDPVKIAAGTHVASPAGNETIGHRLNDLSSDGIQNAPSRRSTLFRRADTPKKRVEFTPSVKNRYDLAAASPSPAKGLIPKDAPVAGQAAPSLFDSAAFVIDPDATESDSEGWESADDDPSDGEIDYPTLSQTTSSPKAPLTGSSRRQTGFRHHLSQQQNFQPKSRNDPGFKSIFTTLRKPSSKASPASIRRVRETEAFPIAAPGSSATVTAATSTGQTNLNFPYPSLPTIPHGLPSKKRRRSSSLSEGDKLGFQDISPAKPELADEEKENRHRRTTFNVSVPGSFPRDSDIGKNGLGFLDATASSRARSEQPEEGRRAAKRTKIATADPQVEVVIPVDKKKTPVSNVRKEAAANAKLRKTPGGRRKTEVAEERGTMGQGKGVLSLSRLNLLARPKDRK